MQESQLLPALSLQNQEAQSGMSVHDYCMSTVFVNSYSLLFLMSLCAKAHPHDDLHRLV